MFAIKKVLIGEKTMTTECDKQFDSVVEKLDEARKILGSIYLNEPWGFSDLSNEYLSKWQDRFSVLQKWHIDDKK